MRELVFKNLTSVNKKRRELFISETVENNGVKTTTQRHSTYIISTHMKFNNQKELIEWQKNKMPHASKKRHVFIFKKRDTEARTDSFVCDVVGNFYAIVNYEVYQIAFKHSFQIDFLFEDVLG